MNSSTMSGVTYLTIYLCDGSLITNWETATSIVIELSEDFLTVIDGSTVTKVPMRHIRMIQYNNESVYL